MFWMIGGDGREYGPVTTDQLREWIAENRANGQTQVRRDGETDWQPLSALPEFVTPLAEAAAKAAAAATTAQPAPLPPALPGGLPGDLLPGVGGEVDIGGCLGRAWLLLTQNFFLLAAACSLVWAILLLSQMVVCVGAIASAVMTGPLMAGLSLLALKLARGQPGRVGDVFTFFSPEFVQFMLLGVVVEALTGIGMLFCLVPGLVLKVVWMFSYVAAAEQRGRFWDAMEASRRVAWPRFFALAGLLLLAWLPVVLVSIYLGVLSGSYFNDLLMSGGGFNFDADKLEQFGRYAAGLELKRAVVMLLNLPFALAVTVQAYEEIFGRRTDAPAG